MSENKVGIICRWCNEWKPIESYADAYYLIKTRTNMYAKSDTCLDCTNIWLSRIQENIDRDTPPEIQEKPTIDCTKLTLKPRSSVMTGFVNKLNAKGAKFRRI